MKCRQSMQISSFCEDIIRDECQVKIELKILLRNRAIPIHDTMNNNENALLLLSRVHTSHSEQTVGFSPEWVYIIVSMETIFYMKWWIYKIYIGCCLIQKVQFPENIFCNLPDNERMIHMKYHRTTIHYNKTGRVWPLYPQ